ncbi:Hypothetical predicted protein [Octopus vulgaris]|uniref:Uncharacterized protein n=1 Tax=Octopus vulgaris TaxID=6645 RepID=A0AA36AVS2_OCTVU|nr:Hypothetical predicted protein [Octopus vulgaris]
MGFFVKSCTIGSFAQDGFHKCSQNTINGNPPYNPDLAPSDCYLFSKLEKDLTIMCFINNDETLIRFLKYRLTLELLEKSSLTFSKLP